MNWLIKRISSPRIRKNNVVFKWREEGGKGQVIGMNRQGTVKMENKEEALSKLSRITKESMLVLQLMWVNRIKSIFMKIGIDMLSHWSIKQNNIQNARLVSMHGLKSKTVIQSLMDAKKKGTILKRS